MMTNRLFRGSLIGMALLLLCTSVLAQKASPQRGPLNTSAMATLGLERDWYFQVALNRDRAKLIHLLYDDKTLFTVSDDAVLHAINTETGGCLWSASVGQRDAVTLEPAVNSRIVAIINGTTVTAYDRNTGKLVWQTSTPGIPLGGCALSENYIYIPLFGGKIIAFNFDYNLGERVDQTVIKSNAGKPKTFTDDPNFDKLDDKMQDVVKAFEQTKRDILPSPTEKPPVAGVTLNPSNTAPISMAVSGRIWLAPTICWQNIQYGLPAEKLRDEYAGKVTYDDFIVFEHAEQVAWVSSLGNVFLASIENLSLERIQMNYEVRVAQRTFSFDRDAMARIEISADGDPIIAEPTYVRQKPIFPVKNGENEEAIEQPSMLIVGTVSGYVFAIEDKIGRVRWQFSTNGAVKERVAVVDGVAYAAVEGGGMHAIDIMTGKEKWYAPQIRAFLAATPKRLYVTGLHNVATVLDRETGRVLGRGPSLESHELRYANTKTDQVFIANSDGLIQAFHEMSGSGDDGVAAARTVWEKSMREIIEEKKRRDAPDDEFRAILDGIVEARTPKPRAEPAAPASRPRPAAQTPRPRPTTPAARPVTGDDPFADPFGATTPTGRAPAVSTDDDPFGDTAPTSGDDDPFGESTGSATSDGKKINLDDDDPFK